MTKADRLYLSDVARVGCVLCLRLGLGATPCECHHPRSGTGAARRAPHSEAIGLCPEHHRGATGLHGMGRKAFERRYVVTEMELTLQTRALVEQLRALAV